MTWTMPHRVLQIVAFLLILACAGAFAMGLAANLQHGGHLPGEHILSSVTGATPVDAEDATPLGNDRIEGPPPVAESDRKPAGNESDDDADTPDDTPSGNAGPLPTLLPSLPPPPAGNAAPAETPTDEPPH